MSKDVTRPRAIETLHGPLALPVFLPDATRGLVRGLDAADLRACGVEALAVSTFHLLNHPGATVLASLGGIGRMMGWDRPVLSDSGGFQIYSLLRADARMGGVSGRGFQYRFEKSGSRQTLTPEKCIQKQFQIGADVLVCLDHCTHPDDPPEAQRLSVEHTVAWARTCRKTFDRLAEGTRRRPLLFAVIQGGTDPDLRRECAERLFEIGFDGYGFGGWPIDDRGRLQEMVPFVAALIPPDKPAWALGIGKPEHLAACVACGYAIADCSLPTRDARHGRLYAFRDSRPATSLTDRNFYETVYMTDTKHVRDANPVDAHCDCPCCRTYSRAYLRHLFYVRDSLAGRLATLHNLRFYTRLVQQLRRPGREGQAE